MSIPIPIENIRDRNGVGQLTATGAEWPEFNSSRFACALFAVVIASVLAYALVDNVLAGVIPMESQALLSLLLIGTIIISCRVMVGGVRKRRSVVFHLDGTIETPDGFPANEHLSEMAYDQSDIRSIESVFNKNYQWGVLVYLQDGHILTWTQYQSKYDAHLIAVTLNNALKDIREAAALPSDRGHRDGTASCKPGDTINIVID